MDHDDSPGLSVGFAVDTGGSFESLLRLERAMDATEGKLLPAAARIERATADMVNLERPSLQLTTFSNAATRELKALNREKLQTAKVGEALIRQLEREAAALGKTKAQMRDAKIEATALAASKQGNTDVADRLLGAARQQRYAAQAVAEAEAEAASKRASEAARQRAVAEAALNAELLDRSRLEAALGRTMGSDRPRATDAGATYSALAARAAQDEAQALRSAAFAYGQFEAAARRGIATHRDQQAVQSAATAETERMATAAVRLRLSIDPAYAAQQRFDREIGEARTLISANAISLDEYVAKLRLERTALEASTSASGKHGAASGQQRAATQQLGFQLNDVATQYASGTAASMIFAQQSGQVIQALQMMSTAGGGVLGFLASWQGAVVSAIAIAAIPFIAKLVEGNNELDKATAKLRKDADQTEITRRAKEAFANTASGVAAAIRDSTAASRASIEATRGSAEQANIAAKNNLENEISIRRVTQAILQKTKAEREAAIRAPSVSGVYIDPDLYSPAIAVLRKSLNEQGDLITQAERRLQQTRVGIALEVSEKQATAVGKVTLAYDRQIAAVERSVRIQVEGGKKVDASLTRHLIALRQTRQAAIDKEQKLQSTAGRTSTEYGRAVSSSQAASIARAAGMQVNSGNRTFASQKALYDRWVASGRPSSNPVAKPGSSAHEFGNALDIQKTAGMTVQRIKDAFASEGVRLTKVFSEQGHWHVEWARSAEDVRAVGNANREAAEAARELEQAQKEVFGWARKSADVMFRADTGQAKQERFAEAERAFKSIIGDADPFGDAVAAGQDALQAKWDMQARAAADQQTAIQDQLRRTAELADDAGFALSRAFGRGGEAMADGLGAMVRYNEQQKQVAEQVRVGQTSATVGAMQMKVAQVGAYGDMLRAAQGFAKEGSASYRALATAEKAYRVAQLVYSAAAMVQDVRETFTHVANAGAKAAADGAAGVAKQSQLPFPYNLVAMAATAAALVATGVAIVGGGGGGATTAPKSNKGVGTVLGDPSAKSESIRRAIDQLRDVDTLMLSHSREMAASLRSIDQQIGGFAAQILKAGNIDANTGVTQGFKPNAIGSVLGSIPLVGGLLKGLFGSTTTVTGSGLYGSAQSLGGILSGGFQAENYSDVQKKSKFLGITTSTKTSTQYTGADPTLENQFTLILRTFSDAIAAAAGPLGESTDAIQQRLNGFVVNIGRIDLSGLTGEQITEKLTAVFGAAADQMASAAFPSVARFQKAGEGLFETAVRVASTLETVGASLDLLGGGARQLSMDAKLGIADQFDSLSALASAADGYFKAYYTSAEQTAGQTARFATVFDSLGMAMPNTLAGFRSLVEAQDLTTAAGQSTYATLLQLAPAFADLKSSMTGVKSAADIASERLDLERQMLELRGDTAAIRALDLAKLDVSNRALQQQVWALSDAQKAADAADQLRQAWTSVGDTIETEIDRIRGLSGTNSEGGFAVLQGRFNAASLAARGGDQDAAKLLPGLSQAMLAAAAQVATSRQELDRVQTMTASSLAATKAAIDAMSLAPSTTSTAALLAAAANAQAATTTPTAANDTAAAIADLRNELTATRADLSAALVQIASNTGGIKRKLDDVTQSGGDAIDVRQAA